MTNKTYLYPIIALSLLISIASAQPIPYLNVLTPTIAPNSIQQLTAGISLGSGSYTYNILVYNSIGSLVYNSLSGATPATSNIVVFTQNPAWGTGTFMANAIITDSGGNSISTSLSYGSYNSIAYVTNYGSSNVVIVNTATNSVVGSINSGFSSPYGVAFNPSGSFAYVINYGSSNVVIVNTATNSVVGSINSGFPSPIGVAFNPSGSFAYVTNAGSSNMVIVNTATNSVVGSINSGFSHPFGVAFNPSGSFAYVTNAGSSNIVIVNTATNSVVGSINSGFSTPRGVAFNPSGSFAYVTNAGSSNVVIVNTATNSVVGSINSGFSSPFGVAFNPSGSFAYVISYGNSNVVIVNTATNSVVGSINSGFSSPSGVAFTNLPFTQPALSQPSISSPSNSIIDVGQYETFNTMFTGGTTPYTYNWIISNAVTGAVVNTITFSNALQTNSITFQIPQYFTTNSPLRANVVVTDANPTTVNSIYSANFIVNTQLVSTAISSPTATNTLDNGQTLTISVTTPTTGSSPYTYNWVSVGTCPTFTSATTSSFTYNPTTGTTSNCQFTATVTDSATTNEVYTATTPVIKVNTQLVATSISSPLAANTLDNGQTLTISVTTPTTGSSPYTYNWVSVGTCPTFTSATTSSFTYNPTTGTTSNCQFTATVTDSATTNEVYTATTPVIKVNTQLVATSISSPLAANTLDNGQTLTISVTTPTTGSSPYTYNWVSVGTCPTFTSATTSSFTYNPTTGTTSNCQFTATVTDSATTNEVYTATTPVIKVNTQLVATSISSPLAANTLDNGQTLTISVTTPTTGSSPYTYNWVSVGTCPTFTSATTSSFTYNPTTGTTSNCQFTATVTDSATTNEVYTATTPVIKVNTQLVATSISSPLAANTLDNGQTLTISVTTPTTGSSPYTYNWVSVGTCPTFTSATTSSFTYNPTTGTTSNCQFTATVTDSATTNEVYTATTPVIKVNTQLVATSISSPLAANTLDNGQTLTISVTTPTTGSSPYTYNWVSVGTCPTFTSATTSSFTYNPTTGTTSNCQFTATVTDSATTNEVYTATTPIVYVNTALSAGTPTATNSIIDVGQYTTLISAPSGGTLGYSYQWSTHSDCSSPIGGATSSSYSTNPSSTTSYYYNVIDSATIPTSACSAGVTVTVNSALVASAAPTPTNPTIDNGQTLSISTIAPTTGTPSYSYQWFSSATSTCNGGSNLIGGATSLSYLASPSTNTYYCIGETDSAYSPQTVYTGTTFLTVNPTLQAGAITPSSPAIDNGQSVTLTSQASGGTPSYTINWFSQASCGGSSIASGTATSVSPSSTTTYSYNVVDSATTPNVVCSSGDTISVNPALVASSAPTPTNPTIDLGQSITLSVLAPSTGTPSYSYQWFSSATSTCNGGSNLIGGATSLSYLASPSTNTYYCIGETDSAYSPQTVYTGTTFVSVNPALSSVKWAISNSLVDYGQTETLNSVITGGTSQYTYNFLVYNSFGGLVFNALYPSLSATQNAFSYIQTGTIGLWKANIIVTDSAYNPSIVTNTLSYTYNAALSGNIISANTVASNLNITLTANSIGGTLPYSYQWFECNPTTCPTLSPISGATSKTYIFANSILGTYQFIAQINDSATASVTFNTLPQNVIVFQGAGNITTSQIAPNQTYPYIPTKFHITIADSLPFNSIAWVFNGVTEYTQNILTNGTYNFTYTYNGLGLIPLNAIITDPSNSFTVYQTVLYKPIINPIIILPILPSTTYQNNDTTLSVRVVNGSFKANTIEWEINGNYLTNLAFNGINYQSYNFPLAGIYSIQIQVCDIYNFCTSASGSVTALSLIPNSFWHINQANIQNITWNASENMRLYFEPYNDTNRISNVTVNWGDGSPLYRVQYQKTITGDLYIHPYKNPGLYNISVTTCDILDNCYSQYVGRISDLTPSQKGIFAVLSALFFNGQAPTGNFSIPSLGIAAVPSSLMNVIIPPSVQQNAVAYISLILVIIVVIWILYNIIIAKFHKHASNWAPFGKIW